MVFLRKGARSLLYIQELIHLLIYICLERVPIMWGWYGHPNPNPSNDSTRWLGHVPPSHRQPGTVHAIDEISSDQESEIRVYTP